MGVAALTLLLAACGHKAAATDAPPPPPSDVAADNVAVVDSGMVESGPSLSGSLNAERSAQLRTQVAGAILSLPLEEGASVSRGQVVAVIDSTALAEAARSARSQQVSANLAAEVAKRNYERSQTLHAAGAIADRDLETAHSQSVAAEAAVADAKSRVATADRQLANTVIRAPFDGVVSARPASVGDVLQSGNPILTIVDPSDLQFEGSVSPDYLGRIKPGTPVAFSVNANPGRTFQGHVARSNPTVDSVTRQVRLYVTVPNHDHTLAAGLFAQGRVSTSTAHGLVIPTNALDAKAPSPIVRRVQGGKVDTVAVTLGLRDDLTERVQVTAGLSRGDTVLVGAALSTPAGAAVRVTHADH
jgi:RND family efflux transporter MFP subunit